MTTVDFFQDNYAPVREELTSLDLDVTGTIPTELDGRLLRIGPNPVVDPEPTDHWFTDSGMAHGLRLRDGTAEWYRNRYINGDRVADALGRPRMPGDRHMDGDGGANTNIIGHAGKTYALVEGFNWPVELTDELESIAPSTFDGTLNGSFTAHPKRHPGTGELHAVNYFFGWEDHVRYIVVGADGRIRREVDVPTDHSPMIHDCSITESAVLILDFPVHFDLDAAMEGSSLPYRWQPDEVCRIGVLPFDAPGDAVQWCELDPCFAFHPLNSFDMADGRIQLDIARHGSMFNTVTNGPAEGPPQLYRWILDPAKGTVTEEQLDDRNQEFPRIDERMIGKEARYGYTVGFVGEEGPAFKRDLETNDVELHDFGPGRSSQEMVFVPRSPDAAEDDGWCLSYVHDANTDTADVVILNAQDFSGEPQATVHLPQRVPYGFHGNWVATES
ncbi:MAG: carotenoid oxygenase family protein [Acidimicrobiales bacterium]|jgi:carotenoid cleavage dioxygenase|nr:carotenoid oxygenase family protein [Acidimicrobiales bacterium]